MISRLDRLRELMPSQPIPVLLVTKPENIFYLSGFSGSAGALVITDDRQWLISDFRYSMQAAQQSPDWTFFLAEHALFESIHRLLSDLKRSRVGFDPDNLTVAQYRQLGGEEHEPYTLVPAPGLIEALRLVKEPEELALIRRAVAVTDAAYAHLLTQVNIGVSEHELALEAEWFMRRSGADGLAFDIIIAAGDRSALPHAEPGARRLQPGDLVVVDMGARVKHYCADMTRTFAVAEATSVAQEIYRVCAEAQLAGVAGIHAGMTGRDADRVVREVIDQADYGPYFGHGTGHGVGVEIHEAPRLNRISEECLRAGTTVTIEPGIYLPDVGGVRIEDLVLLTEQGVEVLSQSPKPMTLPVYG